jgi:hypothetical protein
LTNHNIGPQFIWTYDDVYFTKPVTLEDIGTLKAVADMKKYPNLLDNSGAGPNWKAAFLGSLEIAAKNGGSSYNYETHLPRLFDKKKVLELIEKYGLLSTPLHISTLYFNIFHKDETPVCLVDHNPGIRFMLRSTFDRDTLQKHLSKHLFTNNDPSTWNGVLQSVLEKMFPEKSKFEK